MKQIKTITVSLILLLIMSSIVWGYQWPFDPFDKQHVITGTLGEPRPVEPAVPERFHKGVDIVDRGLIGEGAEVYPVADGTIRKIETDYIIIYHGGIPAKIEYIHIVVDSKRRKNEEVTKGVTPLGKVDGKRHLHFEEEDGIRNPLRTPIGLIGLEPFIDRADPMVSGFDFWIDRTTTELPDELYGRVDIRADAFDPRTDKDGYAAGARNSIYRIGADFLQNGVAVGDSIEHIRFISVPADINFPRIYDKEIDNDTHSDTGYYYWVTNNPFAPYSAPNPEDTSNIWWNTKQRIDCGIADDARINSEAKYNDGQYTIRVTGFDINARSNFYEKVRVIDNFRPLVQKVTITKDSETKYDRGWTFDGTYLNSTGSSINELLGSGTYTITILFNEPVTGAALSIDTFDSITLTSSEPANNQKTFTVTLNIPSGSSFHDGKRTMTISAFDLAGNQILQLTSSDTQINPAIPDF